MPPAESPVHVPSVLPRRVDALDGLRGIAIVLVVLSHGWQLWPTEWIRAHGWVEPVFRSGNYAVTVFLVAAGYLTFATVSRREGKGVPPTTALLRRVVRIWPSLVLMLGAIAIASALDTTDNGQAYSDGESFVRVLTYTWNWYVMENMVTSRPDFGHLWYLSVDMQAFIIVAVLLYLLRRRPVAAIACLTLLWLVLTWWRMHVMHTEYLFQVLVRTTARMDPFVLGAIVGAAVPYLNRIVVVRRDLQVYTVLSLAALVPLMWFCVDDMRFLQFGVTMESLAIAGLFATVALGATTPWPLRSRVLTLLGRHSLLLYIWHYPVFVYVNRHTGDWSWPMRTLLAFVLVVVICLAAHWAVERHTARLMRSPVWERFDNGLLPGVVASLPFASRRRAGQRRRGQESDRRDQLV
ncbi:acyltransferase family protein [Nocardioides sp.]|uniref:acyltransferase family protein n=1 Tax=Nocardioides sp. TaxID=35761 RepID=UPI0035B22391